MYSVNINMHYKIDFKKLKKFVMKNVNDYFVGSDQDMENSMFVIKQDNSLQSWGQNREGQMGDGTKKKH